MEYGGRSLEASVQHLLGNVLNPGDGGLIAVSRTGEVICSQNTPGMLRARADAEGLFEVKIWTEE